MDARYEELKAARRAALNLLEDAVAAKHRADALVEELKAEIEARSRAEESVRALEEWRRLVIQSAADYAIYTLDLERRVSSWNSGAQNVFGYRTDEIVGTSGDIVFIPEDREKGEPAKEAGQALRDGRAGNERWHLRKDGSRFWGSGITHPIRDQNDTPIGFVKIMRDLTEQQQNEAALRRAHERIVEVLESTADAFYSVDADFNFTYVNQRAAELWGRDAASLIGKHYWTEFPSAVGSESYNKHLEVLETGKAAHYETISPLVDVWIDASIYPGSGGGLSVFFRDISQRKRAEEVLRESEEKYRTLFDTIDSGYALTENVRDKEGRVVDLFGVDFNRNYTQHSGLLPFAGRRASEVISVEPEWLRQFEEVTRTGAPARYENYIAERDRWVSTHYSLVGDLGSDRVAVVFDDITDRKRAETVLRESEERQSFLLKLSDALRPLADAAEIQATTTRLLGNHLRVDRSMYAEVAGERGAEVGTVRGQYVRAALPDRPAPAPFPEHFTFETYGAEVMARRYSGEGLFVTDVNADPLFDEEARTAWAAGGVQAAIVVPLVKDGRLVAELGVHSETPRRWTPAEAALVEEAAERTWEAAQRARSEAALRGSEEKYAALFAASPAPILILRPDAPHFTIADVNDAYLAATMRTRESLVERAMFEAFPDNPDDPAADGESNLRASLERALVSRRFELMDVQKYDILRPDGTFEERWWKPANAPVVDANGNVAAIIHHVADVTAEHRAVEALRESEERQAFLLSLSDTLRPLSEPREIQEAAARVLVERLGVNGGAYYLEVADDGDTIVSIRGAWNTSPLDLPPGSRISELGEWFHESYRERRNVVYGDVENDTRFNETARADYRALNIRAGLGVPLWKNARLVALFGVTDAAPREWSSGEVRLVEEVAERTWSSVERARAETAAREFDERLRVAADATNLGVWEWNLDTNLVAWNEQHYRLIGMEPGSGTVDASEFFDRVHPQDREHLEEEIRQAVRETRVFDAVFRVVHDSGRVRWMSGYGRLTEFAADGQPTTMSGVMMDITDRMRMEEDLRTSNERLRLLMESATDVSIFTTDAKGIVNSWNTGSARIYGFEDDEIIGRDVAILFTDEDRERGEHLREQEEAIRNGRALDERWHKRKDGTTFFASGLTQPIGEGGAEGFVKIARDMTERMRAEKARREKELMQTLVNAQELERRRIARDLHDELGQQLTALRLKLDRVGDAAPEPLEGPITEVKEIAKNIDEGVDFLAWELRPAALDDLGLIPAIEKLAKEWSSYSGVAAEVTASASADRRFEPAVETALYRVVQEALNNIHKHAKAQNAGVSVRTRRGKVVLVIDDDGEGFDPEDPAARTRGMGLVGMSERVEMIGGTLEIESRPGHGTTLFVKAPMPS